MFGTVKKLLFNEQFRKLSVYGFGQGFNLVTPLLIAPYIIGICGRSAFGKINAVLSLCFFLMVFLDYGSDISGVKDISVLRDDRKAVAKTLGVAYAARMVMLLLLSAVFVLLIFTLPYFSGQETLYLFALTILAAQAISPVWVLQGLESFGWITFINVFSKIVYLAGIFIFVKQPGDYIYASLFWGLGLLLSHATALGYLIKLYGVNFRDVYTAEISDYLKKNAGIMGSQVFLSAQLYGPVIIIDYFAGSALAGSYSIIQQVVGVFRTYILLFFNFVYPRVCYLIEESRQKCLKLWRLYNGLNFVFIIFAMIAVFAYAEPIVLYFVNKKAANGEVINPEPIIQTLRLATLLPISFAISVPLKQLLLAIGKQKEYMNITFCMVTLSTVLLIVLLHFMGIKGVFISLIISELLSALLFGIFIKTAQTQK
jgi:O-antigen/teichoic acid export membrane protein